MARIGVVVLILAAALAVASTASAQCMNSATPSCGVYETCFAKRCPCEGSADEYFISYGAKYCARFLDLAGLSADGKPWRDATLRCLQEDIVPRLPADGQERTCDCAEMRVAAFNAHVRCYTQPGASMCDLPCADWVEIASAVDAADLDAAGARQMVAVAKICRTQVTQQCTKDAIARILKKLSE